MEAAASVESQALRHSEVRQRYYVSYDEYLLSLDAYPHIHLLRALLESRVTLNSDVFIWETKNGLFELASRDIEYLSQPRSAESTRITFISCRTLEHVDRVALKHAAFELDLNPFFLACTLGIHPHRITKEEESLSYAATQGKQAFLTANPYLKSLKYPDNLSVFFLGDEGAYDVFIIGPSQWTYMAQPLEYRVFSTCLEPGLMDFSWDEPLMQKLLRSLSREQVSEADKHPLDYFCLYMRSMIARTDLRDRGNVLHASNQNIVEASRLETVIDDINKLLLRRQEFISSVLRLSDWQSSDGPSEEVQALLACVESSNETWKALLTIARDRFNAQAVRLTIAEARKSIQLADSVHLLSQLAFIFLPLSLASSIFGMNLRELGSGETRVWIYIVTSISILAASFLALWVSGPGFERRPLFIGFWKLARKAPIHAFWYFIRIMNLSRLKVADLVSDPTIQQYGILFHDRFTRHNGVPTILRLAENSTEPFDEQPTDNRLSALYLLTNNDKWYERSVVGDLRSWWSSS